MSFLHRDAVFSDRRPSSHTLPYRTPGESAPELRDPAVDAYARRVAADRRRVVYRFVKIGVLVALATGALLVGTFVALRSVPERRMAARWREALGCFDHGNEGFRERVHARQLAAIGEGSTWPSRCSEPLRELALAAAAAGHRSVADSADVLANVAARADLENDDLVVPTSTLIDDGARIGLRPIGPIDETEPTRHVPLLSELLASASSPHGWNDSRCMVADDGRHLMCGDPQSEFDNVLIDRIVHEPATDGSVAIRALADGDVAVQACENSTTLLSYSWITCATERVGIGHPPLVSVARLGTKLVVVWVPKGAVGGVRMRIGERGALADAKTRIILDDRDAKPDQANIGVSVSTIRPIWLEGLSLIGRDGYLLILVRTFVERYPAYRIFEERYLALRLDASGEVSPVAISYDTPLPAGPRLQSTVR